MSGKPAARFTRKSGFVLLIAVPLFLLMFIVLKVFSPLTAKLLKTNASESGKCHISRYAPDYAFLGAMGGIFELFSSQFFYRVYTTDGRLLKTSEWNLWMREGDPGIAPELQGEMILYPGSEGWESWIIPKCR